MLFVQSLRGLSHTKLEDTKEEHLELSVRGARPAADEDDRLASAIRSPATIAGGIVLGASVTWSISNVGAVAGLMRRSSYGVSLTTIGLLTTALVAHAFRRRSIPGGRPTDRFGARAVGSPRSRRSSRRPTRSR